MSNRKPQALGDLIGSYLETSPNKKQLLRGLVLNVWQDVVGESLVHQIKRVYFERNNLILEVPEAVWRHEIHLQRYRLKTKLNTAVNETIIQDIIVRS